MIPVETCIAFNTIQRLVLRLVQGIGQREIEIIMQLTLY